jgi:hypothetical protein
MLDGLDERARESAATGLQGHAFAQGVRTAASALRRALEAEVGETSGAGNGSRFAVSAGRDAGTPPLRLKRDSLGIGWEAR